VITIGYITDLASRPYNKCYHQWLNKQGRMGYNGMEMNVTDNEKGEKSMGTKISMNKGLRDYSIEKGGGTLKKNTCLQ